MQCQILLSRKNEKNISKCCLLKFLQSMQSVKRIIPSVKGRKYLLISLEGIFMSLKCRLYLPNFSI